MFKTKKGRIEIFGYVRPRERGTVLHPNSTLNSGGSAEVIMRAEKSTLMPRDPLRKEAIRTLLCGHLIPDLAGIALDYFWVLMFVIWHFLCHSRSERRGVGRVRGDSGVENYGCACY
jgi:hypothetical protein